MNTQDTSGHVSSPLRWLLPGCQGHSQEPQRPDVLGARTAALGVWDRHSIHLLGSSWVPYMGFKARERGEKEK